MCGHEVESLASGPARRVATGARRRCLRPHPASTRAGSVGGGCHSGPVNTGALLVELWCALGGHAWTRPTQRGPRPKNCPDHPRDTNAGALPVVCAGCGRTFHIHAGRIHTARYCSVACRSAAGHTTLICEACQQPFTLKTAEAEAGRRFCSRKCLFAALACVRCSALVPTARREAGHATCSERCHIGLRLDANTDQAGRPIEHWCARCEQVLPASQFHADPSTTRGLSVSCRSCTRGYYKCNKIDYRRRRFLYEAARPDRLLPFTQEQQDARWALWGGRCWVCGIADATEEDHVKPLSAGGWHALANLRPICKSCNARKRDSWPLPPDRLAAQFRNPRPRPGSDLDGRQLTPHGTRVNRTCGRCGLVEQVKPSQAGQAYCSRECARVARTLPQRTFLCATCGVPVTVPGHRVTARFCSTICSSRPGARTRPSVGNPGGSTDAGQPVLF